MSLAIRIRQHGDDAGASGLRRSPGDRVRDQGCGGRRSVRVFVNSVLDRLCSLHRALADAIAPVPLHAAS